MYVVVYDITDQKRLNKVAKLLEQYGIRTQNSTFEIDKTINNINIKKLFKELQDEADETKGDRIFVYKTTFKIDIQQKTDNWEMVF